MSVAAEVSYFSRFLVKFIEIIAAGLATAVSGYLIAHLSGALSPPAPIPAAAINQMAPSTSVPSSLLLQPNSPVSFETNKQPAAPQQVNAPPVAQPGQMIADTKKTEGPRKRVDNATNAAENNQQRKPLLARVRAALANVDAKRTDPLDAPHRVDVTRPGAAMAQPQPITAPAAISNPPIAAGGLRSAPSQDTPVDTNPLPKVEVTSRPVADPPSTEMSPLEQRLRQDPLIGTVDPPRPPMPVAQ
jgi:hypothetical protein